MEKINYAEMFKNCRVTNEMISKAISEGAETEYINILIREKNSENVKLECGKWVDIGNSKLLRSVHSFLELDELYLTEKGSIVYYEYSNCMTNIFETPRIICRIATEEDLKLFPNFDKNNPVGINEFPEEDEV